MVVCGRLLFTNSVTYGDCSVRVFLTDCSIRVFLTDCSIRVSQSLYKKIRGAHSLPFPLDQPLIFIYAYLLYLNSLSSVVKLKEANSGLLERDRV